MESTNGILGKSMCPLVSGTAVELEGSEVKIKCPVIRREWAKNGNSLTSI